MGLASLFLAGAAVSAGVLAMYYHVAGRDVPAALYGLMSLGFGYLTVLSLGSIMYL